MKTFRGLVIRLALLFVLVAFCPLAGPPQSKSKTSESEMARPLVRMDLLERSKPESGPPTRNIFAPNRGSAAPTVFRQNSPNPLPPSNSPAAIPQASGNDASEGPPAPVFSIDLRYIGFVDSRQRMIALIIFQGQTLAVAEGEVISEGIRIGKITKEELQVILPDSSKKSFSLEGEEA